MWIVSFPSIVVYICILCIGIFCTCHCIRKRVNIFNEFRTYQEIDNSSYTMENLITNILQFVILRYQKHFNQWWTMYLLFSFPGLLLVSVYLSRWILSIHFTREGVCDVWCERYNTRINNNTYSNLTRPKNLFSCNNSISQQLCFKKHKPTLKEITDRTFVWYHHVSKEMLECREFVKQKWLHVPYNTQIAEG